MPKSFRTVSFRCSKSMKALAKLPFLNCPFYGMFFNSKETSQKYSMPLASQRDLSFNAVDLKLWFVFISKYILSGPCDMES